MSTQITKTNFADVLKGMSKENCLLLSESIAKIFGVTIPVPVLQGVKVEEVEPEQEEFNVWLNTTGPNKVAVLKVVRGITKLGLKEVKDLIDSAPVVIAENQSRMSAYVLRDLLVEAGAQAELK
jgi:large subunit ribosomal protein L7/L12